MSLLWGPVVALAHMYAFVWLLQTFLLSRPGMAPTLRRKWKGMVLGSAGGMRWVAAAAWQRVARAVWPASGWTPSLGTVASSGATELYVTDEEQGLQ